MTTNVTIDSKYGNDVWHEVQYPQTYFVIDLYVVVFLICLTTGISIYFRVKYNPSTFQLLSTVVLLIVVLVSAVVYLFNGDTTSLLLVGISYVVLGFFTAVSYLNKKKSQPEVIKMYTDYVNAILETPLTIDLMSKVDLSTKLAPEDQFSLIQILQDESLKISNREQLIRILKRFFKNGEIPQQELSKLVKNKQTSDVFQSAENALINDLCEEEEEADKGATAWTTHIGLFVLWVGKVIFDFLLNSTSMVQFFSNFASISQDDPVFYLPNLIYNDFIHSCGQDVGLFIAIYVFCVALQSITDYQIQDFNTDNEGQKYLIISNWTSKMWKLLEQDMKGKTCGKVSVYNTCLKISIEIIKYCQSFMAMILCEFSTNVLNQSIFYWAYIPNFIFFMLIVFQLFDTRALSVLFQHILHWIIGFYDIAKKKKSWKMQFTDFYILIYGFFQTCQNLFLGLFQQILVPFEIVSNLFGIHNSRLRKAMNHFLSYQSWVNILYRALVLALIFLLNQPYSSQLFSAGGSTYLLWLNYAGFIALALQVVEAFAVVLRNCVERRKNAKHVEVLGIQKHMIRIFDMNCQVDARLKQPGLWQGFTINQKMFKYNAIPYIGSALNTVASYLNSPPLAVEGLHEFGIKYILNWIHLVCFVCFEYFYAFNIGDVTKKYWVQKTLADGTIKYLFPYYGFFGIVWLVLQVFDTWDDVRDFLEQDDAEGWWCDNKCEELASKREASKAVADVKELEQDQKVETKLEGKDD